MATRAEIRLAALGLIGDVEELEATHATDTLTFKDTLNLAVESGTLAGRVLLMVEVRQRRIEEFRELVHPRHP